MATEWVAKIGDQTVRTGDLPLDVFIQIEEDTGVPWHELERNPLTKLKAGLALYRAACAHIGAAAPDTMTANQWTNVWELVGDDLPTEFTDGVPSPKAEDEPETITSP